MSSSKITDFVRNNFTHLGIEVKNENLRSVVLSLPADCVDISSVLVEITANFECTVDFQLTSDGPELTVWSAKQSQEQTVSKKYFRTNVLAILLLFSILTFFVITSLHFFSAQIFRSSRYDY